MPGQSYTLVLFGMHRRDMVLSRILDSALAQIPDLAGQLVAVAGCFSAESLEILRARQAIVLQLAEFHWTDESFLAMQRR